MSKRRTFTRENKLAAVRKVIEQGLSFTEVARDLGIRDVLIHNWRKAFEADGTLQTKAEGDSSIEAELKRLREEVSSAQNGTRHLKKATAFFAKENN